MIAFDRHREPDPLLVRKAAETHARHLGYEAAPQISWSVGEPLERATSLVVPILVRIGGHSQIPMYFKSFHPHSRTAETAALWQETFRSGIERDRRLCARFEKLGGPSGIGIRRILAADSERLMLVTLGVEGLPLGKAWSFLFTRGRRELAEHLFTTVGRAMVALEQASDGEAVQDTFLSEQAISIAVRRFRLFLPTAEATMLEASVESLYAQFMTAPERPPYYAHGDIDHANVFVKDRSINLIDCAWAPRPGAFDLSRFLLRLELEIPRFEPWTKTLSTWVVEGYGTEHIRQTPDFVLINAVKLIGLMQRFSAARQSLKFRRARSLLRTTVAHL